MSRMLRYPFRMDTSQTHVDATMVARSFMIDLSATMASRLTEKNRKQYIFS